MCVGLAESTLGVEVTWMGWVVAAIVPGLISLFLVPLVMLKLSPPELKAMPDAHNLAVKELENMGPMTLQEKGFGICFRSLPYPVGNRKLDKAGRNTCRYACCVYYAGLQKF